MDMGVKAGLKNPQEQWEDHGKHCKPII